MTATTERVLEAEFTNSKQHIAFMTGQISCSGGGAGRIVAELFDVDGNRRLDLGAEAHQPAEANGAVACNTLTMPIPPEWKVKCFRIETKSGVETSWAEID